MNIRLGILSFAIFIILFSQTNATYFYVRGELWCQGEPYVGARIMLMEADTLDPDDLLGEDRSAPDGRFEVRGGESEIGDEEPYLLVGHTCPQQGAPPDPACHFVTRVELPNFLTHIEVPPIHLDGAFEFEHICGEDDY
uniref:Transthyretin-like family protein n=1 Tax=Globodera rostochiensis TaxID=31243 RepID=A0A914HT19_GLORO